MKPEAAEENDQGCGTLAPLTVRVPQAARMLSIGRTKLYELIGAGELETIKLQGTLLILVASIHAFVERHRTS